MIFVNPQLFRCRQARARIQALVDPEVQALIRDVVTAVECFRDVRSGYRLRASFDLEFLVVVLTEHSAAIREWIEGALTHEQVPLGDLVPAHTLVGAGPIGLGFDKAWEHLHRHPDRVVQRLLTQILCTAELLQAPPARHRPERPVDYMFLIEAVSYALGLVRSNRT